MKVFVSLAERSASNYVYHIFKDVKGIDFYGITDERLESIGFKGLWKIEDFSVVGIWEAIPKLPRVLRFYRQLDKLVGDFDVLVLCDAPALNIPLLKRVRNRIRKVVYFISPQVWAWKEERARVISQLVDHLIVILPFEVDFYKKYAREGFNVHYVGHPLIDLAYPTMKEEDFKDFLGFDEYVALLPGSRWSEVERHGHYLRNVYYMLLKDFGLPAVIPTFDTFKPFLERVFKGLPVRILTPSDLEAPSYNALAYAKISLVASGTADLEASLLRSPHITYYRVNPITYFIGKRLVKVPYITLTNLILGKEAVPEILQKDERVLYQNLKDLLIDEKKREAMKRDFESLRERLGSSGVIERLRDLFIHIFSEAQVRS